MKNLKYILVGFVALFFFACSSTQVGLKENWIDERDVIALMNTPMGEWMKQAGRPSLVEISGDTGIYYYNYRPTMYMAAVYDSATFFTTWGKAGETKPTLANAVEVWGNRKDVMQIKIVKDVVVSAIVIDGPDKKTFVRDLNGNLILDPKSGFIPNQSDEIKVKGDFNEFIKAYSKLNVKTTTDPSAPAQDSQQALNPTLEAASTPAEKADILAKAAEQAALDAAKARGEAEAKASAAEKAPSMLKAKANEEAAKAKVAADVAETKAKTLAAEAAAMAALAAAAPAAAAAAAPVPETAAVPAVHAAETNAAEAHPVEAEPAPAAAPVTEAAHHAPKPQTPAHTAPHSTPAHSTHGHPAHGHPSH